MIDEFNMSMGHCGNEVDKKNRNTRRKTCPIATLFDTGPIWIESIPPRRQAS